MKISITDIPVLLGAAHGVFLTLVICARSGAARPANFLFAFIVLLTSWQLFDVFLWDSGNFVHVPHTLRTGFPINLLIGPLFYLYTRLVFSDKKRLYWYDALHFLPFALDIYAARWIYFSDAKSKIGIYWMEQESPRGISQFTLIIALVFAVSYVVYFTLSYLTLRKRKRALVEQTSDNAITRNIDHFQFLTRLFLTIIVVKIAYVISLYTLDHDASNFDYLWVLGKSLTIHTVGYLAISRPSSIFFKDATKAPTAASPIRPIELTQASTEKYAKSGLSEAQLDEFYERLLHCIQKEEPHLNDNLNMSELAKRVGVSNHQLSQVINQRAKRTFHDFINLHRIEYAKKLFENAEYDSKHNVIEIAYKAGFNSKASFNRVFKKHTGQTPTDFRNEARKHREAQLAS